MKADFDSEADAILITLSDADHWDDTVVVDDTYCRVEFCGGVPAGIEFLYTEKAIEFVPEAAAAAGLPPEVLEAVVRAALTAPDRELTLQFSDRLPGSQPALA